MQIYFQSQLLKESVVWSPIFESYRESMLQSILDTAHQHPGICTYRKRGLDKGTWFVVVCWFLFGFVLFVFFSSIMKVAPEPYSFYFLSNAVQVHSKNLEAWSASALATSVEFCTAMFTCSNLP